MSFFLNGQSAKKAHRSFPDMTPDVNPRNIAFSAPSDNLAEAPYTKNLLSHAHPEHLHQTSARLFIGPLPEGWVKTHKRIWYGMKKKYTSRAITFNAQPGQSLTRRRLTGLDPKTGHDAAAQETISSTSEQIVVSDPVSTVPSSLQFTSDSGIVPEGQTPEERRDSSLVEVMRDSPVVRFLSSAERRRDEDELRQVEEERAERERDMGEITDLDPLPSPGGDAEANTSRVSR